YNIPSPSSLSLPSTSPIEPIVLARKGYKLINSNDTFSKAAAVEYLQGLKGPCLLRNLKYFNIYNSFVCDTLHNLYLGATAKMLKLLLSKPSVTGGISYAMSVYGQIDNIAEIINSISFPSTTYRQPRDIRLFRKFKGNELRIILLAFENFLDEERYNHLKVLAFIAHIIEGQCLSKEAHKEERELEEEGERHTLRAKTIGSIGDVDGSDNEDGDGILYVVDNDADDIGIETSAPA
ncbi:unnamed protein product, partial [Rotaria sp. Silwood1]